MPTAKFMGYSPFRKILAIFNRVLTDDRRSFTDALHAMGLFYSTFVSSQKQLHKIRYTMTDNNNNRPQDKRLWLGLVFVAIGIFLALNKWSIIQEWHFFNFHIPDFIFRWEIILIGIGAFLVTAKEKKNAGYTLIAIGAFFLVKDILPYHISSIFYGWPSLFLLLGIIFLLRRDRSQRMADLRPEDELNYIDEVAVFGSADRTITSQSFMGGKLTTIFGGADINLIKAELSPMRNELDILTLFGGSTLIVPQDWTVKVKVVSIFGAYDDSRKIIGDQGPDPKKELIVKGFVLFGGGEIKSY